MDAPKLKMVILLPLPKERGFNFGHEENACEFKNETECEEDLDEEGLEVEDAESEHFDDAENSDE